MVRRCSLSRAKPKDDHDFLRRRINSKQNLANHTKNCEACYYGLVVENAEIIINKPAVGDLETIKDILLQWTDEEETDKYIVRIGNEIAGKSEYNLQFWVVREGDKAIGIIGLSDPLSKVLAFAHTAKPGAMKMLYVDDEYRGKGIGKALVIFLEKEAKKQSYTELLIKSAERYKETAWGFYEKMGYHKVGEISSANEMRKMQVFQKEL